MAYLTEFPREAGLVRAKDQPMRKNSPGHTLNMTREDLQHLQEQDETLSELRAMAEMEEGKDDANVFWRNGLLYFRRSQHQRSLQDSDSLIVLPKMCRRGVLELAHSVPMAGHLGRKKTTTRVIRRFYWPTLKQDVAGFCRSCSACQQVHHHHRRQKAPMIPLPVIAEPFKRVAMDIVGPLQRSRSGNRYVLVMCDYATRYPEAVPMKTIDAECIAEELVKIFSSVGIPEEILTDQGSNFQSQLLRELYRLLHINALRTSPYHPQSDGLVERFNQTLKGMLRKVATEEGKDWDKLIPFVAFKFPLGHGMDTRD